MRPGSIDDVVEAYQQALRARRDVRDRLRLAVAVVERLQGEEAEHTAIVRELRDEVKNYSGEIAA